MQGKFGSGTSYFAVCHPTLSAPVCTPRRSAEAAVLTHVNELIGTVTAARASVESNAVAGIEGSDASAFISAYYNTSHFAFYIDVNMTTKLELARCAAPLRSSEDRETGTRLERLCENYIRSVNLTIQRVGAVLLFKIQCSDRVDSGSMIDGESRSGSQRSHFTKISSVSAYASCLHTLVRFLYKLDAAMLDTASAIRLDATLYSVLELSFPTDLRLKVYFLPHLISSHLISSYFG